MIRPRSSASLLWLGLLALIHPIKAFSFNTSTPTQCGQFTVQWDGGTGPFHLIMVPTITVASGKIENITIPTDLQAPNSYTFQLRQPAGLQFLATMSDASGFGSGGTTPALTVGSSGDTSCLESNLNYDFTFSIDPQNNPGQCSSMQISWNDNVTYPLNLYGMIPSGTSFSIPVPQSRGSASTSWQVNIRQNTPFLLLMSDAGQYQTGGSTSLLTVGGGDSGCINSTSPSSASGGSGTGTATSGGSSGSSTSGGSSASSSSVNGVGGSSSGGNSAANGGGSNGGGSSKPNIGAIVGGVVGGVATIILLCLLLWFCLRRRNKDRRGSTGSEKLRKYGIGSSAGGKRETIDILGGRRSDSDLEGLGGTNSPTSGVRQDGDQYQPSPFRYTGPAAAAGVGAAGAGLAGGAARNRQSKEAELAVPGTLLGTEQYSDRPSGESDRTATTGERVAMGNPAWTNSNTRTSSERPSTGESPARSLSVQKHGQSRVGGGVVPASEGTRPLPNPPVEPEPARFVQHQDSGRIMYVSHRVPSGSLSFSLFNGEGYRDDSYSDLPPRYDQLRARNPDEPAEE